MKRCAVCSVQSKKALQEKVANAWRGKYRSQHSRNTHHAKRGTPETVETVGPFAIRAVVTGLKPRC